MRDETHSMIARTVAGLALTGIGVSLAASPEIGGYVTVGFCLFVAGVSLLAGVLVDVWGVE